MVKIFNKNKKEKEKEKEKIKLRNLFFKYYPLAKLLCIGYWLQFFV
jgi:hypothetical protein